MKLNINRKKLRFGGIAIALTAFIIAAVVLLNVLFYSLAANYRWYIDMTSEALFSLSDECRNLIKEGIDGENGANAQRREYNQKHGLSEGDEGYKPDVKVTIYFCDDPDNLNEYSYMRYVYNTALDLSGACDFIEIDYLNWEYNPTSVQKYQKTGVSINSNSIIVESGTEYRTFTLENMFTVNDENVAWAYNGEKKFAGAILAVSSVDQPVAYITTGHSEAFYDYSLLELISDAGYKIELEGSVDKDGNEVVGKLNGSENPLNRPEVRLVVVYNPRSDFMADGVNELNRLNEYLEGNNSLMVFMDPLSPSLPNFEEWLAAYWGVVFDRYEDTSGVYNYMINDKSSSLDNAGYTIRANYETSGGIGNSIYSQMLEKGKAPSVYFENAMSISYSKYFPLTKYTDDEDSSKDFDYGSGYSNGTGKNIFNVFTAPSSAVAIANGTTVAEGGTTNPIGGLTYIFTDTDKKVYSLSDGKILDVENKELSRNENGNYVTELGTELKVENGIISAVGQTAGEASSVISEIIEYGKDGNLVYRLADNGKQILDPSGNPMTPDENGQFKTSAGSILEIEEVGEGKQPSIKVVSGATNSYSPFRLMTISQRSNSVQDTNYTSTQQSAYVLASGSTKFATREYLESAVYGNKDVLLSATTIMGRSSVPVGLDFKPFASLDISDITDAEANRYTMLLTILPPVVVIAVGIVVLVRRKYS